VSRGEQGLRYLLVGAFNTVFGFGLFALAGDSVHYLLILVGTTIVAVLFAFVLNRRFVFGVQATCCATWPASRSSTRVRSPPTSSPALLVKGAGPPVLLAQALVVGGTVVASFLAHRSFSFRR